MDRAEAEAERAAGDHLAVATAVRGAASEGAGAGLEGGAGSAAAGVPGGGGAVAQGVPEVLISDNPRDDFDKILQ